MAGSQELIERFVVESNRIEGIDRKPLEAELLATETFLELEEPELLDIISFVKTVAGPTAELRERPGMNVVIRGSRHMPPPGGIDIVGRLQNFLSMAIYDETHPYYIHKHYERLHPFMDGNGRSGRLLWAWQMLAHGIWPELNKGFLHAWYYQTLEFER